MDVLLEAPMEMLSAVHSNNAFITTVLLALIIPYVSRHLYQFFSRDYPNIIHYVLMQYVLRREVGLVQTDAQQLGITTPILNDELIEIILLYVNHLLRISSGVEKTRTDDIAATTKNGGTRQQHEDRVASDGIDADRSSTTSPTLVPFTVSYESLRYAAYRFTPKPRAQTRKHTAASAPTRSGDGDGAGSQLAELLAKEYEISIAPASDVALEVEPGLFLRIVPLTRAWRVAKHERRQQRRLMTRLRQRHFLSAAGGAENENTLLGGPLMKPRSISVQEIDRVNQQCLRAQVGAIERAARQRSAVMLAGDVLDDDAREFFLFTDMLRGMRLRMRDPLETPARRAQSAETHTTAVERDGEASAHPPGLLSRLCTAARKGPFSADFDQGDNEDTDEESEQANSDDEIGMDEQDRMLAEQDWLPRQLVLTSRAFQNRSEETRFLAAHRQWQRECARRHLNEHAVERGWDAAQIEDALTALDTYLDKAAKQSSTLSSSSSPSSATAAQASGAAMPSAAALAEMSAATGLSLTELREAHLRAPQCRIDQFLFRAVSWYQGELQRSVAREPHFLMYPYAGELEAAVQVRMQQGSDDDGDDDDCSNGVNSLAAPPYNGRLLAVRRYALPERGSKTFRTLFFPQKARVMRLLDDFRHRTGKFGVPGVANKLTILLYGPPGTGKTSLVKAMAQYMTRHILVIPLTTIHTSGALQDWMSEREATCVGETSTRCTLDSDEMDDIESWEIDYYSEEVAKKVVLRPSEMIYLLEDVDAVDWSDVSGAETDAETRAALRLQQMGLTPLHPSDDEDADADAVGKDGAASAKDKKKKKKDGKSDDGDLKDGSNDSGMGPLGGADSDGEGSDDEEEEDPAVVAEKKRMRMEKLFQAVFIQLERDRLSVDGILRVLNGVTVAPSRITVLTTNHPEKLDARLLQPGVIDMKINMEDLDKENALEMIEYYFADHLSRPAHDQQEDDARETSSPATRARVRLQRLMEEYEQKRVHTSDRLKPPVNGMHTPSSLTSTASPTSHSQPSWRAPLKINPARLEQLCVECDTVEQLIARLDTAQTGYGSVF